MAYSYPAKNRLEPSSGPWPSEELDTCSISMSLPKTPMTLALCNMMEMEVEFDVGQTHP